MYSRCCGQNYKFEGKERDSESNLDNFGARYYSSRMGRWLSPDWSAIPEPVPYANPTNPQTLNLYAMVSDNPETFADLDGHQGGIQAGNPSIDNGPTDAGLPNCGTTGDSAIDCGTGIDLSLFADLFASAPPRPTPPQPTTPSQNPTDAQAQQQNSTQNQQNQQPQPDIKKPAMGAAAVLAGSAAGGSELGPADVVVVAAAGIYLAVKNKDAIKKAGSQLERALDHLGKLNGPDQNPNPRRGWRQSVRDAANQIDKQGDRVSNTNLRNAAHFVADALRGLVGP
jgi:RHS repeat-associated protein